jgi:hypothetical protein
MEEPYSNFITPPDFVDDDSRPSVIVIDAAWDDIEVLALWCKTADRSYNIYIYSDVMLDEEWLVNSINRCQYVILNTEDSDVTHIKNKLIKAPNCWYYGPKKFLANSQRINRPIDWFLQEQA